ncbi:hypothetical protein NC653_038850 [Populus alba x Populus x berolinensis]|uniref:Uncharacterized protein n=1 Tax=Populus alba x Populus x berolinensis TaxID=444605 RepID=A0AAD6PUS0_9ROSI|nr:hypothetical protein NC653_038850 [Populus alba x Populus x berolinensis]
MLMGREGIFIHFERKQMTNIFLFYFLYFFPLNNKFCV